MRRLVPRPPGGVHGRAPRRRGRRGGPRFRGVGGGRQVVGAAAGVVGEGRLPGGPGPGAGGGAGRGAAEAVRGGDDGGEGPGAAGADGADGVLPRRHVPLRHRVAPRTLLLGLVRARPARRWVAPPP
ncbi:uncharacterized protein LOC100383744 [Zea mays]|uniref:Uncharacterized protein n=1 Tax=Zea mays TaxID=4577 RepID=C0PIR6_MAIZE|nr:uncharacterized protein LOC100383744 [Zea mays]ACN35082.1 unknown [Zea mays]|eukprot:NP_001338618.1 uncharacterized protein LOC100383744 [Zea mays]